MLKKALAALVCGAACSLSSAHAGLQPLDNQDLRDIIGQAGVTLTADVKAHISKLSWVDDGNTVQIRNLTIDNGCNIPGACPVGVAYGPAKLYFISNLVNAPTLKVDVINDGGTEKLQLQLPDLKTTSDQLIADGVITQPLTIRVRIAGELGLGNQGTPGATSLGSFEIRDLSDLRSTVRIWGH